MAREPFPTPAERTARAMAKMTPGTLRGASRIATPGRAVGRPKRVPSTVPRGPVFMGVYAKRIHGAFDNSAEYVPSSSWTMAGLRVVGANPTGVEINASFVSGWDDGSLYVAALATTDLVIDITVAPYAGNEVIDVGPHHFQYASTADIELEYWAFVAGADFAKPETFTTIDWPHE